MRMRLDRSRALFRVEHVVRTVTNLGACPGDDTLKTNLLFDTGDIAVAVFVFKTSQKSVLRTFAVLVDFAKASAIIFNQPLKVLGTGLMVPAKVFRRISVVRCCCFVSLW